MNAENAHLFALADLWDEYADRMRDEARKAHDRDARVVLNAKSGTYRANAEKLRKTLSLPPERKGR